MRKDVVQLNIFQKWTFFLIHPSPQATLGPNPKLWWWGWFSKPHQGYTPSTGKQMLASLRQFFLSAHITVPIPWLSCSDFSALFRWQLGLAGVPKACYLSRMSQQQETGELLSVIEKELSDFEDQECFGLVSWLTAGALQKRLHYEKQTSKGEVTRARVFMVPEEVITI